MLKRIFLSSILIIVFSSVGAQEHWMQPENFIVKPGEKIAVSMLVGENFMGQPWSLEKDAIETILLHQLSTSITLKDSVRQSGKDNLSYIIKDEGTYVLSMQTHNFLLESDPANFNDFLKGAGLDDALYQRQQKNTLTSPGRENYSVHTKLLIQVGQKKDDTYRKTLGFPVEIIPLQNPYALKIGDKTRFKILIQGKPVFGARVKVWNRSDNRTTIQNIYTEKDGTIEAIISAPGPWMVSVVGMVPSKQAGIDWQSYRTSLVFGVEK